MPSAHVAALLAAGWHAPTSADASRLSTESAREQDYGGVAGAAKATAYGLARGATLGLSDIAFRAGGASAEHLRGLQEHNPIASTVGEVGGALLPALAAPGSLLARTPTGIASGIGRAITESAGHSVLKEAGAAALGAGVEGALQGGGQYLSQVALEDKPLSAEGFVGAMGHGALFAAPVGGGLALAGAALQRARSLFPKSQVSAAAAQGVQHEANGALGQAVADGDRMAEEVRRRVAITDSKIGMAEAGEGVTRRMFGAADPQAMGDQITGGVDRAQMTNALRKYDASKAQLSDWIREEADPALESALTGIATPDVGQPGGRIEKVPGKFGEPELAQGTPITPDNRALMDALDVRSRQLEPTAVGKRPAAVAGEPSLDDLLRGTKEQIDSGKSLGEVAGLPKAAGPAAQPIDQMSKSQLDEFQSALDDKINAAADGDPGRQALYDQWDQAVARRRVLDGEAPPTPTPPPKSAVADHVEAMDAPAFDRFKSEFAATLTPEERDAALAYSGGSHASINRPLRTGDRELSERNAKVVDRLDSMLGHASTPHDMTVIRGEQSDRTLARFRAMKPGEVYTDKGYLSTTVASRMPREFEGNVEMRISVPAGSKAAPIPALKSGERELLLPRNQRYRLDSSTYDEAQKKLVVHVTALGDEAAHAAPAANSLESLLAGTKAKLDEGQSLGEIASGSKLRKDYVTSKELEVGKPLTEGPLATASAKAPTVGAERIEVRRHGLPSERKMEVIRYHDGVAGEPQILPAEEARDIAEKSMPPGYRPNTIETFRDHVVDHGVPRTPGEIRENAVYIVRPSELVERGILGNKIRPNDLASVRQGFAEGKSFKMIEIDMAPNGEMWVVDGNHRLQASAATDRPMAVRFRASDDVRSAVRRPGDFEDPDIDLTPRLRAELPQPTQASDAAQAKSAVPEYAAVHAHETKLDAELEQTLPASAIAERGYYEPPGGHNDAVRTANAKKAIAEGQREAIKLNVTPSGKITVTNGRHRLKAAIEADAPIKVKWSTGYEPNAELDVFRGGMKATEATTAPYDPGADLEALLAKHVAERDGGQVMASKGGFPATPKGEIEQFPTGEAPLDSSYEFSVKHQHLGDTPLKLSVGTKPPQFGGSGKVFVKVERVLSDGEIVTLADAELRHRANGDLYPDSVHVEDTFHRLGIGTRMYEAAEEASGGKLIPSNNQTEMGKAFSAKFRGARDAAADAASRSAAVDGSLEDLLRGTKQKLDEGVEFKDISPADRTSHFDIKSSDLEFDPASRTYRDKAGASNPLGYRQAPEVVREPGLEQAMRDADAAHAAPRSTTPDLDSLLASGPQPAQATSIGKRPLGVVPPASNENIGKTIVDRGLRAEMKTVSDDFKIEQILAKHVGKNVDMGPSLAKAAKAIGDHEMAIADLVEILGPDAPPAAVANAKALRQATTAQADAVAAGTAKAAEGLADKAGVKGALSAVGDIGAAMEVLHALGVNTPDLSQIPVIGPVLSLYFKAKAVMGVLGRKGGSIGRSIEGTVAARSAETRNRIAIATGQVLEGAAKGARKASMMSAGPAVTLANKLFPGGDNPKSKDPRVLYEARMDELSRAQAPGAIAHAVADRIQTADPHLQDAIAEQVERGLKFLDGKAPKQTVMPGMLPSDGHWKPSRSALEQWGKYVAAVNNPAGVLEDLAKGHVTLEGAETLRVVYPRLFAEAQRKLLELAPTFQRTLPYARRVAISIMYQVPVDGTMDPSHVQYLQPPPPAQPMGGMGPPAGAPPAPAIVGPLNLGQQTMTSLDRRAGV